MDDDRWLQYSISQSWDWTQAGMNNFERKDIQQEDPNCLHQLDSSNQYEWGEDWGGSGVDDVEWGR